MITLYSAAGSCSLAAHICLVETDLKFKVVKIDLQGDRELPDGRALKELNPKNQVPVLVLDNQEILTENVAILQYIADQQPSAKLAPAPTDFARYRLQEWLGFISSTLHKTLGLLFSPNLAPSTQQLALQRFADSAAYLEQHFTSYNYLVEDRFSVADAYLYIVLSWCALFNIDLLPYPKICAYQARILQRPSVQEVTGA